MQETAPVQMTPHQQQEWKTVFPSELEIVQRAIKTGIDLKKLPVPLDIFCEYVRQRWPKLCRRETGMIDACWMAELGSDEYYENVIAAADTGDRKLVQLFLDTGFKLSIEQALEVASYLKRHNAK